MNLSQAKQISDYFQLGREITVLQQAPGGLLHEIWRLGTEKGNFAIKVLSADLATKQFINQVAITETIALELAEQEIPAVHAFFRARQSVFKIDDLFMLVYPWIEGSTLSLTDITLEHAQNIGRTIAQIHSINLQLPEAPDVMLHHCSYGEWKDLVNSYRTIDSDFKWDDKELKQLAELSEQASLAKAAILADVVVTHRDLHTHNVIWQDESHPAIIDWEYAGLMNRGMDLLGTALNWGNVTRQIKPELFQAVLVGYKQLNPVLPAINHATIAGFVGFCLDWLAFNMRRALVPSSWQTRSKQEVADTWRAVQIIVKNRDRWLEWWAI